MSGKLSSVIGAWQEVGIYDGSFYLGAATLGSDGKSWSFTPGPALNNGTHTIKAVVQLAGNTDLTLAPFVSGALTVLVSAPVALDLNRDGVIDYSVLASDINHDGLADRQGWVGPGDGLLVWDKNGDGQVGDRSEYVFAPDGGGSDLQALRALADANHDGVLDARDAQFSRFAVWQDANQNGVCDAGELKSLADLGIVSLDLQGNAQAGNPAALVHEAGRSTATLADGSTLAAADASFIGVADAMPQPVCEWLGGVALQSLALTGAGQRLDLMAGAHGEIDHVNLTGHGSQTLLLGLADVLQAGTHLFNAQSGWAALADSGKHQLLVTGDVADTVVVDGAGAAAQWTHTGSVSHDGHLYQVYDHVGQTAQLLLDSQLIRAGAVL